MQNKKWEKRPFIFIAEAQLVLSRDSQTFRLSETTANPLIISGFAKGRLSACKRWPFGVRKTAFRKAKGRLSGSSANQVYICKNGKYMQPTINEALGNCHSALRRGIQNTSKATNGAGCIHWIPRRSAEWQLPTAWLIIGSSKFICFTYHTPELRMNCLSQNGSWHM